MDRGRVSEEERERQRELEFWEQNQDLFSSIGQVLGESVLAGDSWKFQMYVHYFETLISLAVNLGRQLQREETSSAHA